MEYGIQKRNKDGSWQDFKYFSHLSGELISAGQENLQLYMLSMFFRGPTGLVSGLPDGHYPIAGPDPRDPHWKAVLIKKGSMLTIRG